MPTEVPQDRFVESKVSDSTIARMDLLTGSVMKHLQQGPLVVSTPRGTFSVALDASGRTTVTPKQQ